jgi:hypothetical protein
MAGEVAVLVADATPYVTAAVSAYGGAVLAKVRDDAADVTVGVGRRLLQRVFGRRAEGEPLPAPLAALAADPADADAAGMVRWVMRQALEADATMFEEVKTMLAAAQGGRGQAEYPRGAGRVRRGAGHDDQPHSRTKRVKWRPPNKVERPIIHRRD